MTDVVIHNECKIFDDYRSNRVRSMFNVDSVVGQGSVFHREWTLPIEEGDRGFHPWKVGVVVGPSGSGKTSLGKQLWEGDFFYQPDGWDHERPIIECIDPDRGDGSDTGRFDSVTGALAAVGLGDVPTWLRPYDVLSNGEQFRANLAKIVAEAPTKVVVDEFTSVVDRQVARIGAMAFSKAFRRTDGQAILLTCHYDVLEWMAPDWVFDTSKGTFYWGEKASKLKPKVEGTPVGSLVA